MTKRRWEFSSTLSSCGGGGRLLGGEITSGRGGLGKEAFLRGPDFLREVVCRQLAQKAQAKHAAEKSHKRSGSENGTPRTRKEEIPEKA